MKFTALFVLAVPFQIALAQSPEKPTILKVAGQQATAIFANGDTAELKFSRSTVITVPIPFQVTENLCTAQNGSIFNMNLPLRIDRMGWFWRQHHDPTQVGMPLEFQFQQFKDTLIRTSIVTNGYAANHSDLLLGLPKDSLEFQDMKWIPELQNGVLQPFTINTWMSEAMFANSQTGLTENRIVSGANGVHIRPLSTTTGEIDHIDSTYAMFAAGDSFIMIGDVVSWDFKTNSGECQIAMKPNLGVAQATVLKFLATLKVPFQPYIWKQDTLSDTVESQFFEEELYYVVH